MRGNHEHVVFLASGTITIHGEVTEWLAEPNEIVAELARATMRRRRSGTTWSDRGTHAAPYVHSLV